jgi:sigma-B regulation protein RsbU (phosphoserine phosphatase)
MPLGLFADGEFPPGVEVPLEDGDLLLLLTDGATEAQNAEGDFFEAEGVLRVVEAERHRDAAGIVRELQAAIVAFTPGGLPRDDVTTVVCRVSPSP